jgi:hypothetical protein
MENNISLVFPAFFIPVSFDTLTSKAIALCVFYVFKSCYPDVCFLFYRGLTLLLLNFYLLLFPSFLKCLFVSFLFLHFLFFHFIFVFCFNLSLSRIKLSCFFNFFYFPSKVFFLLLSYKIKLGKKIIEGLSLLFVCLKPSKIFLD